MRTIEETEVQSACLEETEEREGQSTSIEETEETNTASRARRLGSKRLGA